MRRLTIGIVTCLLIAHSGCQTAPKTALEVSARTQVIPPDGFGRNAKSVIGPQIIVSKPDTARVIAHLAVAGSDEIWMLCIASANRVPPNFMRTAYTSERTELPLVRLSHDLAFATQRGVDRFTIVIPRKLLEAKRAAGLRLKLYGTQAAPEVELPSWYLDGFLSQATL